MATETTRPAPEHLTTDGHWMQLRLDGDEGLFQCEECSRRVTRNREGREYGHDKDCSHRQVYDFEGLRGPSSRGD